MLRHGDGGVVFETASSLPSSSTAAWAATNKIVQRAEQLVKYACRVRSRRKRCFSVLEKAGNDNLFMAHPNSSQLFLRGGRGDSGWAVCVVFIHTYVPCFGLACVIPRGLPCIGFARWARGVSGQW
ncbi:unnamed protein product [Ectocarpus sp. 12 AP-2014]